MEKERKRNGNQLSKSLNSWIMNNSAGSTSELEITAVWLQSNGLTNQTKELVEKVLQMRSTRAEYQLKIWIDSSWSNVQNKLKKIRKSFSIFLSHSLLIWS